MERPAVTERASGRTVPRPSADTPTDLVSTREAARRLGESDHKRIRQWIEQGRIRSYGQGKQRRIFVSLAEVVDAKRWYDEALTANAVAELLGVAPHTAVALGVNGELDYRRFGRTHEFAPASVERFLAQRESTRAEFMSMTGIQDEFGLAWRVIRQLRDEGRLRLAHETATEQLFRRADVLEVVVELEGARQPCPVCGELAPPGQKWHGECTRSSAGNKLTAQASWDALDDEGRRRRLEPTVAFWHSPEGLERRRALSEEFNRRVEVNCLQCGRTVQRPQSWRARFCSRSCWTRYRFRKDLISKVIHDDFEARLGPKKRQEWLGRWGGDKGKVDGIEKGGRRRQWGPDGASKEENDRVTGEKQRRIFELHRNGRSLREIAEEVFGDQRYKDRVSRFLH